MKLFQKFNTKIIKAMIILLMISLTSVTFCLEKKVNHQRKNVKTNNNNKKNTSLIDKNKNKKAKRSKNTKGIRKNDSVPEESFGFFKLYDPTKIDHLLILDNSISLKNKNEIGGRTRKQIIQGALDLIAKKKLKINFCIANPGSNAKPKPDVDEKRVDFFYDAVPPKIKGSSKITYLGIKQCLEKITKIEQKLKKEVIRHIHIVTDGFYDADLEYDKSIRGIIAKKTISADVIGDDPKAIDLIRNWILKTHAINKGIRYQFDEKTIFGDNKK